MKYIGITISRKLMLGALLAAMAFAVFLPAVGSDAEQVADIEYCSECTVPNSPLQFTEGYDVTASEVIFMIHTAEDSGYAEYSMNCGHFRTYSQAALLPGTSSFVVQAYADDGYVFEDRRMGAETIPSSKKPFTDMISSQDEVFIGAAADSGPPLLAVEAALMLAFAGVLVFAIFYQRRRYDVFIQEYSAIIGKGQARRRSAYRFLTIDEYSGEVSYRVGDNGVWKTIAPNPNGEYIIPKEDVVGHLTIERRDISVPPSVVRRLTPYSSEWVKIRHNTIDKTS